jgi:lysozyme
MCGMAGRFKRAISSSFELINPCAQGGALLMQKFSYSNNGVALTKSFEGLHLKAYQDCAGIWTIGYGHAGPSVSPGQSITEAEAEQLLQLDLAEAVACVNHAVQTVISQSQFDALVDFCFNAGRGNFAQSTLLRKVNSRDFQGAAAQFVLWVHAGGEVVAGLLRRRNAEVALFNA